MATMGKYVVEFVGGNRDPEEVSAIGFEDAAPFTDFWVWDEEGRQMTVARFRQEDIKKITREG
jgi:hypothetical protein